MKVKNFAGFMKSRKFNEQAENEGYGMNPEMEGSDWDENNMYDDDKHNNTNGNG